MIKNPHIDGKQHLYKNIKISRLEEEEEEEEEDFCNFLMTVFYFSV